MSLTNVIINFRRYIKRRNYSAHTVKYYLSVIRQYVLWLNVPLEHAGVDQIENYIDYLHQRRLQPASINLYLAIIRVFYSYLKYEEKINLVNPVKANSRLRVPKPLPRALREDQVDTFFEVIKTKRDWAMFRLMLRCGLRVEEVANVSLGDIDLKQKRIMVIDGKGGKDRVVYISEDAAEGLIQYLKLRSHRRVKKVFLVEKGDYRGQPISVRGIQKRMEYYAKKTGLKISCHHLRHTMATQLLNADAQVESIQDLLGHNWITTTERYCNVSNVKVKRDYFNAMEKILKRSAQRLSHPILESGRGTESKRDLTML
ncbi:MAG: tyrosine-type recombinase/integrase [Deltaproteobacteria bacterium]|nr:tyrosine-type recombinase/integrase [Deltaproteobacteria bacterium]